MIEYKINCKVDPKQIANLRNSVSWNGMLESYKKSIPKSYLYICCFEGSDLVGFLDVVSNGVTDAYIQDVIVEPNFQGQGIGTQLINKALEQLKQDNIFAISVLFEDRLIDFYQKFGFKMMRAGQIETRKEN